MLLESMPKVLSWLNIKEELKCIYQAYIFLLSDSLGQKLAHLNNKNSLLGRELMAQMHDAPEESFLRVLTAPETSYRLLWRPNYDLDEIAGFLLSAFKAEAVRLAPSAEIKEEIWTAVGDLGFLSDGSVIRFPQLKGMMPLDFGSPYANKGNNILDESNTEAHNDSPVRRLERVSRIIPHLCGLPSHTRYSRRLLMLKCFVEDSGKEAIDSPAFVLGAWLSSVNDWERFSDAWEESLGANNPKPLGYHKGHRYYRHHDAVCQEACFAGFTPQEAALKTTNLAHLLIGIPVAGFSAVVPHDAYQAFVKDKAITKRGKLRPEQKLPFYIAFSHLVPLILMMHYHLGLRSKIDFIFDGDNTDKALRDSIREYGNIKDEYKDEAWYPLMGEIIPGDDKELAPLQAADMLAGQLRKTLIELKPQPLIELWEGNRVPLMNQYIGQDKLEDWSGKFNQGLATDILTRIKDEREGRLPPRVMSKKREKKKP